MQTKEDERNKQLNASSTATRENPLFHPFFFFLPLSVCLCVCVRSKCRTHAFLPWCTVLWQRCSSETAAFWVLCDITCCCNNLIVPPRCAAVHVAVSDWWDWAFEQEGRQIVLGIPVPLYPGAAAVMDDPVSVWTGLPQGRRRRHAPPPSSPPSSPSCGEC